MLRTTRVASLHFTSAETELPFLVLSARLCGQPRKCLPQASCDEVQKSKEAKGEPQKGTRLERKRLVSREGHKTT